MTNPRCLYISKDTTANDEVVSFFSRFNIDTDGLTWNAAEFLNFRKQNLNFVVCHLNHLSPGQVLNLIYKLGQTRGVFAIFLADSDSPLPILPPNNLKYAIVYPPFKMERVTAIINWFHISNKLGQVYPRFKIDSIARLEADCGTNYNYHIHNISKGGMCLQGKGKIEKGDILNFHVIQTQNNYQDVEISGIAECLWIDGAQDQSGFKFIKVGNNLNIEKQIGVHIQAT
ncbi:MAG: PilZ domain-containing protein [Bacteriovoracaceae bacterium]|jgi:hypothetical protein|nr:PilZ domain-containing protein [Bacteriovoracaceae bacterium]